MSEVEDALDQLIRALARRDDTARQRAESRMALAVGDTVRDEAMRGVAAIADLGHVVAPRSVVREIVQRQVTRSARGISSTVERSVRARLAQAVRGGLTIKDAASHVIRDTGWSEAYAETVVRTNLARAYTQGMKAAALAPELAGIVGGWRYDATGDSDVRPNHWAANGHVAHVADPCWHILTPPLGFNCRCALSPITREEAAAMGGLPTRSVIPPGAGPDPGFVP